MYSFTNAQRSLIGTAHTPLDVSVRGGGAGVNPSRAGGGVSVNPSATYLAGSGAGVNPSRA